MSNSNGKAAPRSAVLVVDDHPLFREGVVHLIDHQADLRCCGEADCATAMFSIVRSCEPDLVLLDLRLKDADGLELIKSLKMLQSDLPILVLSQYDEGLYAERALRAGAMGYITKQNAPEEVLTAIRTVLEGELYVSRSVALRVLHQMIERPPETHGSAVEFLSDRELHVFQLLGAGMGTRQIATELNLSFKTIETYRENIKHTLGLQNSTSLVRCATEWVQNQNRPAQSPGPGARV